MWAFFRSQGPKCRDQPRSCPEILKKYDVKETFAGSGKAPIRIGDDLQGRLGRHGMGPLNWTLAEPGGLEKKRVV